MRSTSRAASTNRFAEFRIIFRFFELEPERSRSRTRSKGVSAAAKNVISCGTPSSRTRKSLGSNAGGGLFGEKPRTLTFKSTRSESMRIVSTGSCAATMVQYKITSQAVLPQRRKGATENQNNIFAPLRLCGRNLIRIIPTFAARHCISSIDPDLNRTPSSIACAVCRTIRQTVHRTEIGDDLFVSTGEIGQSLDLIKNTAARTGHFLHAIVAGIKCFGLSVERAHGLILRV